MGSVTLGGGELLAGGLGGVGGAGGVGGVGGVGVGGVGGAVHGPIRVSGQSFGCSLSATGKIQTSVGPVVLNTDEGMGPLNVPVPFSVTS